MRADDAMGVIVLVKLVGGPAGTNVRATSSKAATQFLSKVYGFHHVLPNWIALCPQIPVWSCSLRFSAKLAMDKFTKMTKPDISVLMVFNKGPPMYLTPNEW